MPQQTKHQGAIYDLAALFASELEAGQTAAADQMLAAWTSAYWATRQEIDVLLAKVEAAKAAGQPLSPAWAYQQQRLKNLLATTKTQIHQFAQDASDITSKAQQSAIAAGAAHAAKLGKAAVAESLPGALVTFTEVNPEVLKHAVGFLADGSTLSQHLAATLPHQAAQEVQDALLKGLSLGWGTDRMLREITTGMALSASRATTILRTESLRVYRAASRSTYMANADVLGGWVWNAHLDSRTCLACALMDGTIHPIDAVLDGHPRCRCAMVPRTKSWAELGLDGLEDTRPPVRSGKAWLEDQAPHVQRAMMGPRKFDAWVDGHITLDDMVGRTYSPKWGTMRTTRSLKAIAEERNANWFDSGAPIQAPAPKPTPQPNMTYAKGLADDLSQADLETMLAEDLTPQEAADFGAALAYAKAKDAIELGPWLPPADETLVTKALANLAKAVETKGYPSKGYSQARAVWKARANGKVGTPVGPVKELTWQQKVDAQVVLARHDEALPGIVAELEAKAAEAAAATKAAKAAAREAVEKAAKEAEQEAYGAIFKAKGHQETKAALEALREAKTAAWAAAEDGSLAEKIAKAEMNSVQVVSEAYDDAQAAMKDHVGHWVHTTDATMDVADDGWAVYGPKGGTPLETNPVLAQKMIQVNDGADWTKHVVPNQGQVDALVSVIAKDGTVSKDIYDQMADALAKDLYDPQTAAEVKAALAEADAMKWTPDPEAVAVLKHTLDGMPDPEGYIVSMEELATLAKPQAKANIAQAIAEWKAEKATKATLSIPPNKPTIDPAKIKWDKVSDAQVAKLLAKVDQGSLTLDDLYASYQASKNSGPKANYAKAILTLEQKADTIPTQGGTWPDSIEGADGGAYTVLYDDVVSGLTSPDELVTYVNASSVPGVKAAGQQVLLDLHAEGKIGEAFLEKAGIQKVGSTTWNEPWTVPKPMGDPIPPPPPAPKVNAPKNPPWKPEDLKDTGKRLGTHGAQVWEAPDGSRWLFKPPKDARDQFLVTLDEAASRVQAQVGLKSPDTYVVTLGGKRGSIQRMFDATDAFPGGLKPTHLNEMDLEAVQAQHVLDWLLSNHDGHRDQFLRLPTGDLVGIDKGQAFRWFGQDRLDWEFHPNQAYGAPEPVYNSLWRAFARGEDVHLDPPGHGALAKAIRNVQDVSDDDLRAMFRPYAEEAAARGLLAKRQSFPGLAKSSLPENDVEAFLDGLVARKRDLAKDFQDLYDRAAQERTKNLPGWTKPEPPGAKWVGKAKPEPPTPPVQPGAQVQVLFDPWLAKVKAKYEAFSGGKSLESSNNWTRVQKVIEQRDRAAVRELLDRHYLDEDLALEALETIDAAEAELAKAEAAFKRAEVAHAKAVQAYKKDLADWKDANGIVDQTQGMDDGVKRHGSNSAGTTWGSKHFKEERYNAANKSTLQDYTGSYYRAWNDHLRATEGKPTQYQSIIKLMDEAMGVQPIPEDVILHRGIGRGSNPFSLGGARLGEGDDLTRLIGSVQVDHGYISTSVGAEAAFSGSSAYPIQLKIRAVAGTPGSYVKSFSHFGSERELILGRGTRMYVHNAYKDTQRNAWVVEVEVVPDDFDAAHGTPNPSSSPWSAWL